jgi:hypothetical protein
MDMLLSPVLDMFLELRQLLHQELPVLRMEMYQEQEQDRLTILAKAMELIHGFRSPDIIIPRG